MILFQDAMSVLIIFKLNTYLILEIYQGNMSCCLYSEKRTCSKKCRAAKGG